MSDQISAEMVPAKSLSGEAFPLDSFGGAARDLRRPFTPEAVKWKVQVGFLVVPYIDARLVVERLNLVVPHLWFDDYEALAGGKGLLCRLTVGDITRLDVGSGYEGKGLFSDALKRAAVKFGVGVSLYALPKVFLSINEGQLKDTGKKDKKGRPILEITEAGRKRLDSGYRAWLKEVGEPQFGEALDHGDVEDATGDVEAEAEVNEAQATLAVDEGATEKLTDAKAVALIEGAEKRYKDLPKEAKKDRPPAAFRRELTSAWHSHEELEKLIAGLGAAGV